MDRAGNKYYFCFVFVVSMFFYANVFAETILLKSGKKIDADITEKTEQYIKIDLAGVPLTYFYEDIDTIDGEKIFPGQKNKVEDVVASIQSGLKIIDVKNSDKIKNPNKNSIIYYKKGNISEAKITRRVKDEIFLEASSEGIEMGINIADIDRIETVVPGLLNNLFVNEQHGINMAGPKDWVMITPDSGYYREAIKWSNSQLVYFHKNPIEDYRLQGKIDPFISIVVDGFHPFINTAWDYAKQRASLSPRAQTAGPEDVEINGRKWVKLDIQFEEPYMRQVNYFLLRDKNILWISFGDTPDNFMRQLPVFEAAFNSLVLS